MHETCLEETLCFLLMFLTGFSSLSVLLLFPLLIAFIFFRYSFLFLELSISNDLTQMVTWILTVTLTVVLILLFSDASICSTLAFSPLGDSYHVVVSVSTDFASNSKWNVLFHCIAYDYSCGD